MLIILYSSNEFWIRYYAYQLNWKKQLYDPSHGFVIPIATRDLRINPVRIN